MYSAAMAQYRQTAVQTASPGQLIVMLYDGCIRFARAAAQHLAGNELDKAAHWTARSQEIIMECLAHLDPKAGQISASLASLYEYFHRRLREGLIQRDAAAYEEVITRLSELRAAWAEIAASGQAAAAGLEPSGLRSRA